MIELVYDFVQRRKTHQGSYRLNDAFTNISCGIIDQATGVFAKVATIGVYALVYELLVGLTPWTIPSHWATWVLCFVAVDLAYYWSHRLSHEVNLFWVGHVVHHQSEDYNLSVALRQGAFQKVLMLWVYLPLAAIGFPTEWFVASIGINLLYQFWIHTEYVNKMGWLEWVLNTPSHHRVHHGRNPKYIDKNHAGVFIVWDRLFGTFKEEEERPTYGITRPLNTFNPVLAHVQPFADLWRETRSMPSWADRFRYLFSPPGWYPAQMGGFKPAPELSGDEVKYDRSLPLAINLYLLVQYAIVVGFTAVFLFTFAQYSQAVNAVFLCLILFQVYGLGNMFDKRPSARMLELVRHLTFMAASVWLSFVLEQRLFGYAVLISSLVGTAWFAILWSRNTWNGKA
jgi:sterol desaturase/sphingolipid hydroxylase (fatty acid hydroxylase superfamily)